MASLSRRGFLKLSGALVGSWTLLGVGVGRGQEPIKIGISISVSGRFERPAGYLFEGHKLWAEHVNAAGGLGGRPVELIFYDDKSDPAESVKLVRKLITDDRVDFLFSPYGSELTAAVAPTIEEAGVPAIASIVATMKPWKGQNAQWMVQFSSPAPLYLAGAVDLTAEEGDVRTIAILYEDTPFPTEVANGLRERAQARGLEIVLDEKYDKAVTDWTPLVAKAKARGAEFLAGGAYFPAAVGITKAAAAVGYQLKLMALVVGVADPKFATEMGPLAEGMAGNELWLKVVRTKGFLVPGQEITNEEFVRSYTERFGREPEYWSAAGYGAGQLLAQAITQAIEATGEPDRMAVRDFLFTFEGETIYGPYGVHPLGTPDAGLQRRKDQFIIQWQRRDGELTKEVIWPAAMATAEPLFGWPRA